MKKLFLVFTVLVALMGCQTLLNNPGTLDLPEMDQVEELLAPFILAWGEPDCQRVSIYPDESIRWELGWSQFICPKCGQLYHVTLVWTWNNWELTDQHGEILSQTS